MPADPRASDSVSDSSGERQLEALHATLRYVLSGESLVARRLRGAGVHAAEDVRDLDALTQVPLLTRAELVADQAAHPPYGTNLHADPAEDTVVSSTRGSLSAPGLRWLHTRADHNWLVELWHAALTAAGVGAGDVVVSSAAFAGAAPSWTAFVDATTQLGVLCAAPSSSVDEQLIAAQTQRATILLCTPADVEVLMGVAGPFTERLAVRLLILSGAPGGCVPRTRRLIEDELGARCADVYGLLELGVVGWQCGSLSTGLHLHEGAFVIESIDPFSTRPSERGEMGELVVTALGCLGMPVVRYRTGDLVRLSTTPCACGRAYVRAEGGVLGRCQDLLLVRETAVLPGVVETIIRRHLAVQEYQLEVYDVAGQTALAVQVEPYAAVASEGDRARVAAEVAADVRQSLGLRLQCEAVPAGSLPRLDAAAPRIVQR